MCKKIVVILGHQNLEDSVVNQYLIKSLEEEKNVEIRNLSALYKDFKIDVKKEQACLEKAEKVVLQFPFQWYNAPAIIKQWLDEVFEYGFAFCLEQELCVPQKLKDKEFMLSVSIGAKKDKHEGIYPSVNDCLRSFLHTARMTGMKEGKHFYTYGTIVLDKQQLPNIAKDYKKAILA